MTENFSSDPQCPFHGKMAPKLEGLPLFGNFFEMRKRPLEGLIDGAAKHGSIFRLHFFGQNMHVVSGQTAIDLIRENDESRIHRRRIFDAFMQETDVDIFGAMGDTHRLLRDLVRLGFSRQIIAPFVPEMVRRLTVSIGQWPAEIVMADQVSDLATEAAAVALTPHKLETPLTVFSEFATRVMMVIIRQQPSLVFSLPRHRRQRQQVREGMGAAVTAHQNGEYDDHPYPYMIDAFLHTEIDGHRIGERQILGMGLYTLGAAYSYCGRLSTFMLFELLKNPKLLSIVLKEVDAAFDGDGVDANKLRRMTYLRATYHEALRRYPMLPGLMYRASRDLVIDGYEVPKDDLLLLTGVPAHFLEPNYDNPWAFDPHRCMAPRNEHRNPASYSPWGFRPRVCAAIGLNEVVILTTVATVLRNAKLELLRPSYEFDLVMRPLLCPHDGCPVRVVGFRRESDFAADRGFLVQGPVEVNDLLEPMYDFELPQLEPEEVAANEIVFRQGDPATDFYMIVQGTAEVIETTNGQSQVVAELRDGDSFGEIGLLRSVARTATIKAREPLKLLRLNREQFFQAISDSDLIANELGALIQNRFVQQSLLRVMPSLRAETFAEVGSDFEIAYFEPGDTVFEQGEAADAIYVVVSGTFEVIQENRVEEQTIKRCGPGEMLGEIGIIKRQPRSATVRNSHETAGVMAKISRECVEKLLASSDEAQSELAVLIGKRLMADVERMSRPGNPEGDR